MKKIKILILFCLFSYCTAFIAFAASTSTREKTLPKTVTSNPASTIEILPAPAATSMALPVPATGNSASPSLPAPSQSSSMKQLNSLRDNQLNGQPAVTGNSTTGETSPEHASAEQPPIKLTKSWPQEPAQTSIHKATLPQQPSHGMADLPQENTAPAALTANQANSRSLGISMPLPSAEAARDSIQPADAVHSARPARQVPNVLLQTGKPQPAGVRLPLPAHSSARFMAPTAPGILKTLPFAARTGNTDASQAALSASRQVSSYDNLSSNLPLPSGTTMNNNYPSDQTAKKKVSY